MSLHPQSVPTTQSTSISSRRGFLAKAAVGSAAIGGWAAGIAGTNESALAAVTLQVDQRHELFRVRMEMDVKGNVNLAKDPMVPDSPKRLLPIDAKMSLDYEERYLRPAGSIRSSELLGVERQYYQATGTSTLNRTPNNTKLRDSLGSIIGRRDQLPETLYSTDDYLASEEIELLRTPVASCAIDNLVPSNPLGRGETIEVPAATLASVFNLTAVVSSDVQMELVSTESEQSKLQMRGKLEGSVAGVPTQLHLLGKLTFEHATRTVSWAAIAIHETREIGKAEPGFDVTATIRMIRKPLSQAQRLPAIAAKVNLELPPPQDRLLMNIGSEYVGFSALMDRRWRIMKDAPGEVIMRMIENDRSIAQLNLRPLARLGEGEHWTLEAFEEDVKRKLDDRFGEFLQSEVGISDGGLRMLRVVAAGQVQGVPIQWIMMHFSDDERRRLAATLTMDGESVPKLDGSDVQMAASMQLTQPQGNVAETRSRDKANASDENSGESSEKLGDLGNSRLESVATRPDREESSPSDTPVLR